MNSDVFLPDIKGIGMMRGPGNEGDAGQKEQKKVRIAEEEPVKNDPADGQMDLKVI